MINQEFIDKEIEIWTSFNTWYPLFGRANYEPNKGGFSWWYYTKGNCNHSMDTGNLNECMETARILPPLIQTLTPISSQLDYLLDTQTEIESINTDNLTQYEKDIYLDMIKKIETAYNDILRIYNQSYQRNSSQNFIDMPYKYYEKINILDYFRSDRPALEFPYNREEYGKYARSLQFDKEYGIHKKMAWRSRYTKIQELKNKIQSSPTKASYLIESYTPPTTTTQTTKKESNLLIPLLGLGFILGMG